MKLSDYLKQNAAHSGIKDDDANLVKLLDATKTIDVDDTIAAAMGNSLLTMDAAKNNPTLKSHFTAQALKTLDTKIDASAAKFGLSEDQVNELKAISSTYERNEKLADMIAETTEKKAGKGKEDKDKAVKALEAQLAEANNKLVSQAKDFDVKLTSEKSNFILDTMLSSFNYALPEGLSNAEKIKTAKTILAGKMDENGVNFNLENDKLTLKTKEGTTYYKNNVAPSPEDFVKQILTEKKLLVLNDAPKGRDTRRPSTPANPNPNPVKYVSDNVMNVQFDKQVQ